MVDENHTKKPSSLTNTQTNNEVVSMSSSQRRDVPPGSSPAIDDDWGLTPQELAAVTTHSSAGHPFLVVSQAPGGFVRGVSAEACRRCHARLCEGALRRLETLKEKKTRGARGVDDAGVDVGGTGVEGSDDAGASEAGDGDDAGRVDDGSRRRRSAVLIVDFEGEMPGFGGELSVAQFLPTNVFDPVTLEVDPMAMASSEPGE